MEGLTLLNIVTRVRQVFPEATLQQVAELVNEAIMDQPAITSERHTLKLNVVSGKRYYRLPPEVQRVIRVRYQNSDDEYVPITRLVGDVDTGDTT